MGPAPHRQRRAPNNRSAASTAAARRRARTPMLRSIRAARSAAATRSRWCRRD